MNPNAKDKIHELLSDFSTVFLNTHGQYRLRARPMAIAHLDADNTIWFITALDSMKTHEVEYDTRAQVIAQKDRGEYVSLNGNATVVTDQAKIEEYWKEPFKIWFPLGKADPNIALIEFTPTDAEYWDNHGLNKATYLWETAKAYISGKTPDVHEEQHGVAAF